MKKVQHTLLIAISAAALASGCVEEQGSMFISGALPVTSQDNCVANPAGNLYLAGGILDLGLGGRAPGDYTVALEVTTNLPATFTTQDVTESDQDSPNYPNYGNADTNVIIFEELEVYFVDERGQPIPQLPQETPDTGHRFSVIGGSVFNQQTTLNAKAALFAPLLTNEEAELLASVQLTQELSGAPDARVTIFARVRVSGRTTGASTVRSPEFTFPIELCRGCLFRVGADENGDCPAGTTLTPAEDPPCFEGQDAPSAFCL